MAICYALGPQDRLMVVVPFVSPFRRGRDERELVSTSSCNEETVGVNASAVHSFSTLRRPLVTASRQINLWPQRVG